MKPLLIAALALAAAASTAHAQPYSNQNYGASIYRGSSQPPVYIEQQRSNSGTLYIPPIRQPEQPQPTVTCTTYFNQTVCR